MALTLQEKETLKSILRQPYKTASGKQIQIASGLKLKNNPARRQDYMRAVELVQKHFQPKSQSPQNTSHQQVSNAGPERRMFNKQFKLNQYRQANQQFQTLFQTHHKLTDFVTGWADALSKVAPTQVASVHVYDDSETGDVLEQRGIHITAKFDLTDPKTKEKSQFHVEQHIDPKTKELHYDYFEIDNPAFQGRGLVKQLFKSNLKMCDELGITKIKLHAALGNGGYSWLRYGGVPDDKSMVELQQSLWTKIEYNPEFNEKKTLLQKLLHRATPKTMWTLAAIPEIGKKLFKGVDWHGEFDLNKKSESRQMLNSYLAS